MHISQPTQLGQNVSDFCKERVEKFSRFTLLRISDGLWLHDLLRNLLEVSDNYLYLDEVCFKKSLVVHLYEIVNELL